MTKKDLLKQLADRTGVHKAAIDNVLGALSGLVEDELSGGGDVILPGIGKLSTKVRSARMGANPATGEPIDIPEKRVPSISFSGTLKEAVGA